MYRTIEVGPSPTDRLKLDIFRPELTGYIVKDISGITPVKATVNISSVATGDGGIFNSSRIGNRNITIQLEYMKIPGETIESLRQKTYRYFPEKRKVYITLEDDNRKVETEGIVESNDISVFSKNEGSSISILCADPYLYDVNDEVTVFSGVEPLFSFPFQNESLTEPQLAMGLITHKTEQVVNYKGDLEVGVSIYIHSLGDVRNLLIVNTRTRKSMRLDTDKLAAITGMSDTPIIEGDTIIINTQQNNKNATLLREGVSYNILNCIDRGSDWFTISKGDNIFAYSADEGATDLQFQIINKVAYGGV